MTVTEAIRARRSIRKYKPDPVPPEHVRLLLEAAMMAPSAVNTRPWEFAVIRDRTNRERIAAVSPPAKPILAAPLAILVSGRTDAQKPHLQFWPQDAGAAIENLLLQALDLGYGTCWCGLYPLTDRADIVREILGLDPAAVPMGIIAVGVPDETPAPRGFYDENKVKYF